jgi:hypothetical protein
MIDLENSCNQILILASVLDHFGEVSGLDIFLAFQVGNGAGYLIRSSYRPWRLICRL